MGLQRQAACLLILLAALFLLQGCDTKPVECCDTQAEIDERAVLLARFALSGLSGVYPALYKQAHAPLDSTPLPAAYSDDFITAFSLSNFINCVDQFNQGQDVNCLMPETTFYGIVTPMDWALLGSLGEHLVRVQVASDSTRTVEWNHPAMFQEYDSLNGAMLGYFGFFESHTYTYTDFRPQKLTYTFYPLGSPFDSVEAVIENLADSGHLSEGNLPDSGLAWKHYYYDPDSASLYTGGGIISNDFPRRLSRYVWFKGSGADYTVDSVVTVVRYTADSTVEIRSGSRLQVMSGSTTLLSGVREGDTLFADTLSDNSVVTGLSDSAGANTAFAVENSAGDTVLTLVPDGGSLLASVISSGAVTDSLRFTESASSWSWSLSTSELDMTGTITQEGDLVRVVFSGNNSDFSGEILFNVYTREGLGFLSDSDAGYTYDLDIDLAGSSWIETERL